MHSCPLFSPFGLKSFLYFQRKKFLSGPILKIPLMWNPCCVKQKKKKSLTVEEVFFPADCKCSFLCCFLNDLGNFRNHKTINTYIHFVLFCFGSMCKLWQEQLLFIFRSPGPTILLLKKTVIFLKCMTSQICKYQRIKAGGPLCFIQSRHFRKVKN